MASEILMEPYQAARDGCCPKKTTVSAEEGNTGFFGSGKKKSQKRENKFSTKPQPYVAMIWVHDKFKGCSWQDLVSLTQPDLVDGDPTVVWFVVSGHF